MKLSGSRRLSSARSPAESTWNVSRLEFMTESSSTPGRNFDGSDNGCHPDRRSPQRPDSKGLHYASRPPALGILISCVLTLALNGCRRHDFPQYPPNYREYAYITNGASNTVTILDVVNLRLDRELPVGPNPVAVAPSPTRNEVYVVNSGTGANMG